MIIGILGMPLTGKTTIFNLLTSQHRKVESYSSRKTKNIGVMRVADERVDALSRAFQPKKTTYASIEVIDIPGVSFDMAGETKQEFFTQIQKTDALLMVIRVFNDNTIPGSTEPVHQAESLIYEILIHDLEIVENRITRLNESKKRLTNQEEFEKQILIKCLEHLGSDQLLATLPLNEGELKILSGFSFFTLKPTIIAINIGENNIRDQNFSNHEKFNQFVKDHQIASIPLCGKLEMEINELPEEEKNIFLEDLGFKNTGAERLSHVLYEHLGLISFFTVGKDEVKAWTIKRGTTAIKAAGKVHSDMERGFIRAEIVDFNNFKELGSMQKVKEKGLFKVEGKDHLIEDGDIVNFRFNV